MRGLSRSKRLKLTLAASLFVILSVPLVLYAILSTEDADTRSDASTEPIASCLLTFPYVNPNTIESGAMVQVEVQGYAPTEQDQITAIRITSEDNVTQFIKEYDTPQNSVTERFVFTRPQNGSIKLIGQMNTTGENQPCIVDGVKSNLVTTQAANSAPVFKTDPTTSAQPRNSISIGQNYSYELLAEDPDGDEITYAYSFTPRSDWLTISMIDDGLDGTLKLKLEGTPTEPGSYLANVFIHDGYNTHLRSQSWVISVASGANDTPSVTITEPPNELTKNKGENIKVSWTATDRNQILKYKLYYAANPGNQNSWRPVDENISYKVGSYIVSTGNFDPGTYKFIVQAEDNQSPTAIGMGLSENFTLLGTDGKDDTTEIPPEEEESEEEIPPEEEEIEDDTEEEIEVEEETDDGVVLQEPQVINLNPADGSKLTNSSRTISATIIAGETAELVNEKITLHIDDKDVSEEIQISQINPSEATVVYVPTESFENGEHKVFISFRDTAGNEISRDWNFSVDIEETDLSPIFDLLGINITNRTILIIVVGLGIILLALIVPWLLYIAWRDSDEDSDDDVYSLPPYYPGGGDTFKSTYETSDRYYKPPPETETEKKTDPAATVDPVDSGANKGVSSEEAPKEKTISEQSKIAAQLAATTAAVGSLLKRGDKDNSKEDTGITPAAPENKTPIEGEELPATIGTTPSDQPTTEISPEPQPEVSTTPEQGVPEPVANSLPEQPIPNEIPKEEPTPQEPIDAAPEEIAPQTDPSELKELQELQQQLQKLSEEADDPDWKPRKITPPQETTSEESIQNEEATSGSANNVKFATGFEDNKGKPPTLSGE